MDNVFIINHIVQREREEKESKVYAVFVDLKATFDNVRREDLWRLLEDKGINRNMIRRIRDLYAGTMVSDGLTNMFCTRKGVRQGCVLSPVLFNLYIADIDKYLLERGIGGVKLGNVRIWTLAYADDMVLIAKNRKAILDMMNTLKRYLGDRRLILNTKKTKVLVFNRKRNEKVENWRWEGKELVEVQCFKYLGFIFNRKGNYVDHIKDLAKKGRVAANKVWGLGERICKDDFSRR